MLHGAKAAHSFVKSLGKGIFISIATGFQYAEERLEVWSGFWEYHGLTRDQFSFGPTGL